MRSSWEEVEKLFINEWRQKSTPLHMLFVGKTVPLSVNASVHVADTIPTSVSGSRFLCLRGRDVECFVSSDTVSAVEYSEPSEERPSGRERYVCFIEFKSADGSVLALGEISEQGARELRGHV